MQVQAAHRVGVWIVPEQKTSSLHRIVINIRLLVTGYSIMRTKKENAAIMAIISAVLWHQRK